MTLDEFCQLSKSRIPTGREFVAFVRGQGWDFGHYTITGVRDHDRDLAVATANMLKREPYRSRVKQALDEIDREEADRVIAAFERAVTAWNSPEPESGKAGDAGVRGVAAPLPVVTPVAEQVEREPEQCGECRAMIFGSAEDAFRCCDRTECPFAPSETWWKRSGRR